MNQKGRRLASFAPAAPAHPYALSPEQFTLAKHRKTSARNGEREETGFLPNIQKPASPRWLCPSEKMVSRLGGRAKSTFQVV
jgi:hypothetical protein